MNESQPKRDLKQYIPSGVIPRAGLNPTERIPEPSAVNPGGSLPSRPTASSAYPLPGAFHGMEQHENYSRHISNICICGIAYINVMSIGRLNSSSSSNTLILSILLVFLLIYRSTLFDTAVISNISHDTRCHHF